MDFKVSVAMTTYNGEMFVIDQLDSIRNQSLSPDEVIICDDGSTDDTVPKISDYITRYSLIDKWQIIQNKINLGFIENFCKAISLTTGKYVFLSDQDDIFYEKKFETMIKFMQEKQDCILLNAGFESIDEYGNRKNNVRNILGFKRKSVRKLDFESWLYESSFPGFSMCLRDTLRNDLSKTNRTHCYGHDQLIGLLALNRDGNYEINDILSGYRSHDKNVTGGKKLTEDFRISTRIKQKENEYREYVLLENLIEDNLFNFEYKQAIEHRKKILNRRISYLRHEKLIPLIKIAILSKAYPRRTIIGDILYLLKHKKMFNFLL